MQVWATMPGRAAQGARPQAVITAAPPSSRALSAPPTAAAHRPPHRAVDAAADAEGVERRAALLVHQARRHVLRVGRGQQGVAGPSRAQARARCVRVDAPRLGAGGQRRPWASAGPRLRARGAACVPPPAPATAPSPAPRAPGSRRRGRRSAAAPGGPRPGPAALPRAPRPPRRARPRRWCRRSCAPAVGAEERGGGLGACAAAGGWERTPSRWRRTVLCACLECPASGVAAPQRPHSRLFQPVPCCRAPAAGHLRQGTRPLRAPSSRRTPQTRPARPPAPAPPRCAPRWRTAAPPPAGLMRGWGKGQG